MGTWGTGLFSSDMARDIRDFYRERIEDGTEDAEATRLTLEKFRNYLDDPEEGRAILIALAVTQSKIGRLDPAIRDRALAAIDSGGDLDTWEQENPKLLPKRREVLDKARAQLTRVQPARKRLRPPPRPSCGLSAGDILALRLPNSVVLFRVVQIKSHRRGETPYLERLDFNGSDVPSPRELEQLEATGKDPIDMIHASSGEVRFSAFTASDKIGWKEAGFEKVGTIAPRPGDDQANFPGYGVAWSALVERYRQRAAV
jgi:ribosomal 50S subunit-recycling heat shock protein